LGHTVARDLTFAFVTLWPVCLLPEEYRHAPGAALAAESDTESKAPTMAWCGVAAKP
jgi:hypothetical protein